MTEPLRILILEDNSADAEMVQFELEEAGIIFTTRVVMVEEDFIRAIQEFCPDLILSDYDLPTYNGALALAEANRRCPDTPFILVTGAVTEDRAIDFLTGGAKDYVLKNRLNQRLAPAVRRALAEAEEHRARKQAEEDLRKAHRDLESLVGKRTAELQAILDTTPVAIWIAHDPECSVITGNAYADEIIMKTSRLGNISRSAAPAESTVSYSVFHDGVELKPEEMPAQVATATGKPVMNMEVELVFSDGRQVHLIESAVPLFDHDGRVRGAVITGSDVSRIKQSESAFKQMEERQRLVLESSSIGTFEVDLLTGETQWNATEFELLGRKPGEVVADPDTFFRFVHPDDIERLGNEWGEAMRSGKFDSEFRIVRADGQERWLAGRGTFIFDGHSDGRDTGTGGKPWRFMGVNFDITARKMAEEAISRNQRTLLELVERSPFGMYIVDSDFRIAMMNASSQTDAFRNVRPIIGRDFAEAMRTLWPEPVAAEIIGHFRHTLETGEPYFSRDFINPRHDADIVEAYEWELHRMTLPDGRYGVICYYYDSTELRGAEEALRESEAKTREIVESIQDPFYTVDRDWRIIYVNTDAQAAFHKTRDEMIGHAIWDVFPISRDSAAYHELTRSMQERSVTRFETLSAVLNRWVEVRVYPTARGGLSVSFRDITERKQAEAEIARLASYPMLNPNPILEVDFAGEIHFANPAAERLFPDLLQGKLEHPFLADWEAVVRSVCESGLKESMRDLNINGRWYQETLSFVEETKRIHIYGRDVTARKEAEEESMKRAAELEDVNKDLGSFSYFISHDLRAPLRAITGYSQMILKEQAEQFDEETRRRLQTIVDSSDTMGRLIDDMLTFARLGSQTVARESIAVEDLIGEVWREVVAIHPDREMTLKVSSMATAYGGRALIWQVYSNLLGNAAKFTQRRNPAVVEAGSYIKDGEAVYYVRDNGVGFDMRFHDKLFGVFQRLHGDEEYKGTGIGLALVKRIINRHGGKVWAEGEVNKGATFYFTLPTPSSPL